MTLPRESLMDYALLCFVTLALSAMMAGAVSGLVVGVFGRGHYPEVEEPMVLEQALSAAALAVMSALAGLVAAALCFIPAVLAGWLPWQHLRHHRLRIPATLAAWTLASSILAYILLPEALLPLLLGALTGLWIAPRLWRRLTPRTEATP